MVESPKQDWKLWHDKYIEEGAKIFDLKKYIKQLEERIEFALEYLPESPDKAIGFLKHGLKGE